MNRDGRATPPWPGKGSNKTMETITLVRSTAPRRDPRLVIYKLEGRTGSVQFLSTLFGGNQKDQGNPPTTLTLTGTFAAPKPKETPAERKARLAAITPAERLAKMEERVAKMKAKLAASDGGAAPTVKADSAKVAVAPKAKR